ncbi:hypothetical protein C12CBH8_13030 [Solibaculum mannosilyticum]|uniref:Helix-hairpin-helix domain-containing protein n=1 Tax=Solibaculum mannosilyticum TaxID=2780922 RepID=A0A7I8D7P9_9FIRM|nr:hypothetical protein C12CBH8_13030 [Solibaculum mannosilyticum]
MMPNNTEKQKEAVKENQENKIKAIVAKMKRPRNLILLGVGVALLLGMIIAAVYYISMGSDPDDYTMLGSSRVTSSQSSTVDSSIADSSMMSSEIMSSEEGKDESDVDANIDHNSDANIDNIIDSHQASTPAPTTKPSGGAVNTTSKTTVTPSKAPSSTAPTPSKAPSSAAPPPVSSAAPVEPSEPPAPAPVNINTATRDELMTLTGINISLAKKIIAYREAEGPFEKIEDLMNVYGIDERIFNRIKDDICV